MRTSALTHDTSYNGFTVLDITSIPDFDSLGIWLRHEATGLEVFHMLNDDEENLFGFVFKTPPEDSTGAAHILEHSVLCGSKNYPLKDPFIRLGNQSVKTFLNAMTFPDKTVYPASSLIEADYFNLMAVYGDAVFFPLLKKEIFLQEAHRLEIDETGNVSIQGVVYNEMKGNYSSFESVVSDWTVRSILPGTAYAHDAGGDPAEIPNLSYEKFKNFHKKYYDPSNCRLFLYGNIATEKQLDFLNERFLNDPSFKNEPFAGLMASQRDLESFSATEVKPFTSPVECRVGGPSLSTESSGENSGPTVLFSWLIGVTEDPEQFMEAVLISQILLGHDGSPLSKALIDCGLGEDIAPNTGVESELRYLLFSVGLREMQGGKESELEKVIIGTIQKLIQEGVPHEDIEAAIMAVDFADREIKRSHGPYSLTLMRRCLRGWLNGAHPAKTIFNRKAFQKIKEKLASDPLYLKNLLRMYFIENKHMVCLTVTPEDNYEQLMKETFDKQIAKLTAGKSRDELEKNIKEQMDSLHEYQSSSDSEQLCALLPHIHPSDLDSSIDTIKTERFNLRGIPSFLHRQSVNGIVYAEIGFPCDTFSPSDFPLLPFFSTVMVNTGFSGMDWAEAASYTARISGSLDSALFTSSETYELAQKCGVIGKDGTVLLTDDKRTEALYSYDPVCGRSWIFFRVKMLSEKTDTALDMFLSCITGADFSDTKRLSDLLKEYKNDIDSSVIPAGNSYALSRTTCTASRSKAIDEIWNGLSQLYYVHDLCNADVVSVRAKLENMKNHMLAAGAVINIICEDTMVSSVQDSFSKALEKYLPDCGEPQKPFNCKDDDFYALTRIDHDSSKIIADKELIVLSTQVGFASCSVFTPPYDITDSVYLSLAAHWLTNGTLWEKIRTMGGAYGAYAFPDMMERTFSFATYRDPKPEKSLETWIQELEKSSELLIDDVTMERIITGSYSKEIQPRTPSGKGGAGFMRALYGISDEKRAEKLKTLLNAKSTDIQKSLQNLLNLLSKRKMVIIFNKSLESAGKIIVLPL